MAFASQGIFRLMEGPSGMHPRALSGLGLSVEVLFSLCAGWFFCLGSSAAKVLYEGLLRVK